MTLRGLTKAARILVAQWLRGTPLAVDRRWRELTRAEREAQRRHASVRHIQAAKRARVHELLRGAR